MGITARIDGIKEIQDKLDKLSKDAQQEVSEKLPQG